MLVGMPPERVEMTCVVREEPELEEPERAKEPPCSRLPRTERTMRRDMEVVRTAAMLEIGEGLVIWYWRKRMGR
jgi:hypothetical protein